MTTVVIIVTVNIVVLIILVIKIMLIVVHLPGGLVTCAVGSLETAGDAPPGGKTQHDTVATARD